MNIGPAKLVYFSPTQTTQKVIESITRGMEVEAVEHLDLTPPTAMDQVFGEMGNELAIIGAPVYGGRVPIDAVGRLRRLKGNGTPAVVIVVYGNREYEDALLELKNLVVELGFVPIAGGAFIGEHSFSSDATPLADGRPDADDSRKAVEFGQMIQRKMRGVSTLDKISPLQVPGDFPYKERAQGSPTSPITPEDVCEKCGTCARVCPTAAITVGAAVETDQGLCIRCSACVKSCPTGARVWTDPGIEQAVKWLSEKCRIRKEPELYL